MNMLTGRVALVSGSGRGFRAAIARIFAAHGKVASHGRENVAISTTTASRVSSNRPPGILWAGMLVLCAIAIAAIVHRMIALAYPLHNVPPQVAALDEAFARKPITTLAHIVPALVFVLLVPLQFSPSLRARYAAVHRWIGRILMTLGAVIGLSALLLLQHPIGGITEVTAILFYDALFLLAMTKAFVHIRRGQVALHREWVIRGISVALGVATVRPIMGMFFATSPLTGLTPHDFFGIAFWIGFTATYIFAEMWIRRTRPATSASIHVEIPK